MTDKLEIRDNLNNLYETFVQEIGELRNFIEVVKYGFANSPFMARAWDVVSKMPDHPSKDMSAKEREHYKKYREKIAKYSKDENEKGLPHLFEIATVRLWAIVETIADEIPFFILDSFPETRKLDIICKVEGPLMEFVDRSHLEQNRYLLEVIKYNLKTKFKKGVGQIEGVLSALDFGGEIVAPVRKMILELQQVRHVFVHKNRRADEFLIVNCPWLGYSNGDIVQISNPTFGAYIDAVTWCVVEIHRRIIEKLEIEETNDQEEFCEELKKAIENYLTTVESL